LAVVVPEAARRFGNTPAFVTPDGHELSYAQLDRLSDEAAAGFSSRLGIGEGQLVVLALPSNLDYVVAYAALAKLGAVTAGINPRLTAPERARIVDRVRPDHVLATATLADGLPLRTPVTVIEPAPAPDTILAELRDGFADATPPPLADPAHPDRLVAVVFTSGTTGTPKGAMFANAELAAITTADVGDRWGGGGHLLATTAFAHVGFMTKLAWYLRLGTTQHLIDRWDAREVLRLLSEHRMASLGGVAPQVALLLREPTFDEFDLSSVQTIVMGGAASPPAMVAEARHRFGAAYSIRYSSTESGGVGTGTAFDTDDTEALETVGRPRTGVELEIRDGDDRRVADGEIGEVCLRSPCMLRGYWRDPEATAEVLRDGWLHTGDLGRIDDRGCLRLAGRAKELFIRGGYNVYPQEVEAVLASHPAVAAVAVVPRPHPELGEIGVAVVVPTDSAAPPTLDELRTFARASLAAYKVPEALRVVDELPQTAMQKLDRAALAAAETDAEAGP
jgi:acyl-CoA synthetase (AMP-forming)/AMP-acid ligase II